MSKKIIEIEKQIDKALAARAAELNKWNEKLQVIQKLMSQKEAEAAQPELDADAYIKAIQGKRAAQEAERAIQSRITNLEAQPFMNLQECEKLKDDLMAEMDSIHAAAADKARKLILQFQAIAQEVYQQNNQINRILNTLQFDIALQKNPVRNWKWEKNDWSVVGFWRQIESAPVYNTFMAKTGDKTL